MIVDGTWPKVQLKELNGHLEARNEAKPMIGNITKPIHGTFGKENPNLGRRMVVQKSIVPTTSVREIELSKGTMKPQKDVEGYKMPITWP
jgi:hypothetical protein